MRLALLLLCLAVAPVQAEWLLALPGWNYQWPRDHGVHPGFKTEWWYFTGNLRAADDREFGFQLTFFRQGISPGDTLIPLSRFVTHDLKFAHFALSEVTGEKFHFQQRLSRGAYGEAGFDRGNRVAWLQEWSCERTGDNSFHLKASLDGGSIDLEVRSEKAPVVHGENGVSQKASGAGRASHYYSLTRLTTEGTVTVSGETAKVAGTSWFDHEWATNQLGAEQVGWDWFSLQFDDQTELMLFQLRLRTGGRDEHSAGTFIDRDGKSVPISQGDFTLEPSAEWTSSATKARYPLAWKLSVPKVGLDVTVRAALKNQELVLDPVSYWEGAVRTEGQRGGQSVKGSGYLEMTGYAGQVVGLQETP